MIDQVRGEQKEKQKVYQTVSVMCGLIIILLIFVKAPKAVERQELYECKFDF